jgi:hypothetical protein
MRDVLLEGGELGPDAAGLPDVRRLREPVGRPTDHAAPQPEPPVPRAAVRLRLSCRAASTFFACSASSTPQTGPNQ